MDIPSKKLFRLPILKMMGDGKVHHRREIFDYLYKEFQFSEETQHLARHRICSRTVWALANLRAVNLLENTKRGYWKITEQGQKVISENPSVIDQEILLRYAPKDKEKPDSGQGSDVIRENSHTDTAKDTPSQEIVPEKKNIKEEDMYPILTEFLRSKLGVYSKRIDEKKSKNSRGYRGNMWLYPDLVGLENLSKDWGPNIKECVKLYSDKMSKLWSFEVKKEIKSSNIREYFFQSVSNSSWANFGYLVAHEIDEDIFGELRILSSLHGIGFIRLNIDKPSESQILIPAKEKTEIDWNIANRLAEENKDFKDYIELIKDFCKTGKLKDFEWD